MESLNFTPVLDEEKYFREEPVIYCEGFKTSGEKISARCSYPNYICYCINLPHEYPSCQCSRETSKPTTTEPPPALTTTLPEDIAWKPLYVLGIGGGVLLIVILTSIACCCVCRHWYARNHRAAPDKPPEYSDSPPPPYVHSSFYNTTANRSRTVHRVVRPLSSSRSVTRNVSSAIQQHSSRGNVPVGITSSLSEQNIQSMQYDSGNMPNFRNNPVVRTERDNRSRTMDELDRVQFPVAHRYATDNITIVDLDDDVL